MRLYYLVVVVLLLPLASFAAEPIPGIGRPELFVEALQGKRVALVVNQASLYRGAHAIDLLLASKVSVVKLFALEHGVRGEGGAGEEIKDGVDEKTGLPIVSLYGAMKKPDARALAGVDAIVYDVQDVGVRFFTYISSLGLLMEAAAENRIALVVLDRANPNGDYTDGPLLKPENKSFVGAFPIPLVYGMTVGELARMIQGERWQKNMPALELRVVPLKDYDRSLIAMPEARPSPGLRSLHAIRAYPSLALFEPTVMSFGRGTEHPFAQYGIPGEKIGKHTFTPRFAPGDKNKIHDGRLCYGEEFYSRPIGAVPRFTTDIFVSALGRVRHRPFLTNARFLELLVGDKRVVKEMLRGKPYHEIRKSFAADLESFLRLRKKYLLY